MDPRILTANLAAVRSRIAAATAAAGRTADCVTLVGASKSQPPAVVRAAVAAGLLHIGESYVQEALPKIAQLPDLKATWHFIGQLQANKTRPVAAHFDWVHGVDRLRIAQRLSEQRPFHASPLNVCIQVNLGGQDTKGGVSAAELPQLLRAVASLPRLKLRGLMSLPPAEDDPARQRHWAAELRRLLQTANAAGLGLDTLSMGMSSDLEAAITEGSTLVRVGTDIFGPRSYTP